MLNALQILVMLPLLEASVPANAGQVFRYLAEIAAFDVVEISEYVDQYLDLVPTAPVNHKLETLGFESRQYINNVGCFFFYITACSAGIACWILFAMASSIIKQAVPIKRKLNKLLFWNRLIQAVFESFLIVTFSGLIAYRYKLDFYSSGQRVQSWYALVCFAAYMAIPLYCLIKVGVSFSERFLTMYKSVYGYLYEGLATHKGRVVLLHPTLFLLRRLFLATMVIYGTKVFIFQMTPLMISNVLISAMISQLVVKRKIQMLAEVATMVVTDLFMAFNMIDAEDNFTLGYAAVAAVGAYIAICAFIILRSLLIFIRKLLRRKLVMRKYRKWRNQLRNDLKTNHHKRVQRFKELRRAQKFDELSISQSSSSMPSSYFSSYTDESGSESEFSSELSARSEAVSNEDEFGAQEIQTGLNLLTKGSGNLPTLHEENGQIKGNIPIKTEISSEQLVQSKL